MVRNPRVKAARAKKPAKPRPAKPPAMLTQFEHYQIVEVHRSEIKFHPKNPRLISEQAQKKLEKGIDRFGLLEPLVVNKTTGFLIGGHQRLRALDKKHRDKNYRLRVCMVELDAKAELEAMVLLNNAVAQGEWDAQKLEKLYREEKLDFESTGFDVGDIYRLFGDSPLIEQPEQMAALAEKVRKAAENYDGIVKTKRLARDDVNFYLVVVHKSHEDRLAFTDRLGLPDNRFVDGRHLLTLLEKPPSTIEADCDHCGRGQPVPEGATAQVCVGCGQMFALEAKETEAGTGA